MENPYQLQPHGWQFASVEEALFWSADVLRARSLPRLTSLWREILAEAPEHARPAELDARTYASPVRDHLPSDADDRLGLALAVEKILDSMGDAGQLLRLHAWGDWVSDASLRAALVVQERLRRNGVRLRLNYRLSLRQLGDFLQRDKKTVSKHLHRAMALLARRLDHEGLLFCPHGASEVAREGRVLDARMFRH